MSGLSKSKLVGRLKFWARILGLTRRFTVKILNEEDGRKDTYAARSVFDTDTDRVLVRFNPHRIHQDFLLPPAGTSLRDEYVEFPATAEEVTRHEVIHLIVNPLEHAAQEYVRLALQRFGLPEGAGQREYNAFQEMLDEKVEDLVDTTSTALGRAYEAGRRDALRSGAK